MPLAPGTKLECYEIISALGMGGMGEVYRARDTRLGRDVAIKVLPESFAHDADRLQRFEQEARAVAALNHPNLLAIHDFGEHNGVPFMVSELLEGKTLRTELDGGALSTRRTLDYAAQIAQGLAAAHDKNIVHRDLKPENVFITKEGRVKILDFGLAKLAPNEADRKNASDGLTLTSSPTEAGVVMGTAGYMAPEQIRGTAVDSRTDIFAFGAVLYEMVSGQRAFRRDTAAETMTAILKEDPPDLSELPHPVSPGVERIVRRCLEKQPEQRFQSAKDLAFALEALSGTSTRSAAQVAMEGPSSRPRWMALAAGAMMALAAGAGLAWYFHPIPAQPTFTRISFSKGDVIRARATPDGKTIVYSAQLEGAPPDTYVIREDYPESTPAGLHGALLLSISRQGQMAVLIKPTFYGHFQWGGTLALSPMGGGAPRELLEKVYDADFSPDGNDLAVITRDHRQWSLQYPIGKVLLLGENWISEARVSPDGKQVALFRHPPNGDDRGEVIVLDRSGVVRTLSSGWESLEGLAWAPSGKEVLFSAAESGSQYCIRAVTLSGKQRTIHCSTGATRIHDIAPSGRAIVSTDEARRFISFVEHGTKKERDLSWLNASAEPHLSADGSLLLFTDYSENAGNSYVVYVRKTDGSPAVRIGRGAGNDISPDGKWVLMVNPEAPGDIGIVPVGPGQTHTLHWPDMKVLWASWYPDGRRIFFAGSRSGRPTEYYVTDVNGTDPKQSPFPSNTVLGSFDEKSYMTREDNGVVLHSVDGGASRSIAAVQPKDLMVTWSSDSGHIFVMDETHSIYKIGLDSATRELWYPFQPKDQAGLQHGVRVAVTPDGRWAAFEYSTRLGQLYTSDTLK